MKVHFVASELKDPIWHSLEWQIGSFSSEATLCSYRYRQCACTKLYLVTDSDSFFHNVQYKNIFSITLFFTACVENSLFLYNLISHVRSRNVGFRYLTSDWLKRLHDGMALPGSLMHYRELEKNSHMAQCNTGNWSVCPSDMKMKMSESPQSIVYEAQMESLWRMAWAVDRYFNP